MGQIAKARAARRLDQGEQDERLSRAAFHAGPKRAALCELLEDAKATPVIGRTYPLSRIPEAIRYLEQGHAQGKVVITISADRAQRRQAQ